MRSRERNGTFVGRGPELAALADLLSRAGGGSPSVLLIGGDAGIGKSTLLAEAARRSGREAFLGRCAHVNGEALPLAPLVDLLRQIRRSELGSVLARPEFAPLAALIGPPVDAVVGSSVFDAVLDLFGALGSDGPEIVGFEDLHRGDALTWDLVEFLARNLTDEAVVLAVTYRPGSLSADPEQRRRMAELSRLPEVRRISVTALEGEEITEQVRAIVGTGVSGRVVDEIAARGAGNPLFTEELALSHLAGEPLPSLLVDLFAADIAELDEPTRAVVSALSVIGRPTADPLLAAVVGIEELAIERALHSAVAAELLIVDGAAGTYRLRHPLLAEVVVGELLPSERRRIHRRVADALAADPSLGLSGVAAQSELAFHLDNAGDVEAAFVAALAAADAVEGIAMTTALEHLERALHLWPSGASEQDRIVRLWQAAEFAYVTGSGDRAVELADAAIAAGDAPRGPLWAAERRARYLWTAGRLEESGEAYAAASSEVDPADRSVEAAALSAGIAQGELMFCRFDAAQRWCDRALDIVDAPDVQRETWVHAMRILGLAQGHDGWTDEAIERCRSAVDAAVRPDDRALAVIYLVEAHLQACRWGEAVSIALDGAAAGERAGFGASMGGYLSAMAAEALLRLGRWSEAELVLDRVLDREAVPYTSLRTALAAAVLAARRGRREDARRLLEQARRHPTDPWHQAYVEWCTADVELQLGDLRAAATAAEAGFQADWGHDRHWPARFTLQHVATTVEQTLTAVARREPVDTGVIAARLNERIEATAVACTRFDGQLPADASAHLAHARALITDLEEGSAEAWASAASAWKQLCDPWATAMARLHEADAEARAGRVARAADCLTEAHTLATDLCATTLLERIEAVATRNRISVEAKSALPIHDSDLGRLGLTSRESEVLALVAQGMTNRQIGERLFVSQKTASVHVSNILRKLDVPTRVDAAVVAQRLSIPD